MGLRRILQGSAEAPCVLRDTRFAGPQDDSISKNLVMVRSDRRSRLEPRKAVQQNLVRALRAGVAAACILSVAAPPSLAQVGGQMASTRGPLDVRLGQAAEFTRVEFRWTGGASHVARRDGQTLTLSFNRDARPDLTLLRVVPPKWLKAAEARHAGGRLQVVLTLPEGGDAKVGQSDGAIYVNLFQAKAPPPAEATVAMETAKPLPPRPNPIPRGGVVRVAAQVSGDQVALSFPWAAPNGAAVFRRADAVWIVFDAPARLDIAAAPRGVAPLSKVEPLQGPTYSALKVTTPRDTPVFAASDGATWTVTFGPGPRTAPALIDVARDAAAAPPALTAQVAGVTQIVQLPDPAVGDVITVATALGPSKALPSRREYVEMALLPSAQGLAMEAYASDLVMTADGDLVSIARPEGLALSPAGAAQRRAVADGAPQAASMPALINYQDWPRTGSGGFLARYDALLAAAAAEEASAEDAPIERRLALARFLVGAELAYEAIGVLNALGAKDPSAMDKAEFRGLRGIARVMARRYKEAETDFAAPQLAGDPSSALWRSYIAAQQAQWTVARQEFALGAEAFDQMSPTWKARFARGEAQAALALGDIPGANNGIRLALLDPTPSAETLATRLLQARIAEAEGYKGRALGIYNAVATAPADYLSAPALLRATQIRYEQGQMTPAQAVNVFDGLRYRWRGDATELETTRLLGQLYLGQGRYREALEALRSAGMRLPDLPEALQLQADLAAAFRALFLDGQADGLQPIQALAMFYDFKELTPVGADGDLMVRKLVRRLVDVDLLDQAAELLKYQVDNRLDGVAKAQVATDLALIHLMDRQPEKALLAINSSRTTVLPNALNAQRRALEARALVGLGRYDHALEVLERETSPDARDLRADIAWRQKDWARAGPMLEQGLGERWKAGGPLTADEEARLIRAGVAYSLASDNAALGRLQQRYGGFFAQARNPEALRVALSGVGGGQAAVADFSRLAADDAAFQGWVAKMKQRFRDPAPAAPARPVAPTKQAAAAAPATQG